MENYYLPISSECLAHYLSSALISPAKYLINRPNDIQTLNGEVLLISLRNGVKDCDCSLELILTESEKKSLVKVGDSFFLFKNVLPISRIRRVFFRSNEQRMTTMTNIGLNTAYFPEKLVSYENLSLEMSTPEIDLNMHPINDLSESIKMFDRRLGAFALMKLSGESYMNYSEKYFSVLSIFNSVINQELIIAEKKLDSSLVGLFSRNKKWQSFLTYLDKDITIHDLDKIAKEENQKIQKEKITKKIILTNLERRTHILAVLYSYGVADESRRSKIGDLLLSNFRKDIPVVSSETIAMCYGYNRGYSVFNKEYKTDNSTVGVKFKMNSQLDYYTIESLYLHTFTKNDIGEFSYLDNWCPKLNLNYKSNSYKVLDEVVICKKKPTVGSKEYFQESFGKIKNKFFDLSIKQIVEKTIFLTKSDLDIENEVNIENRISDHKQQIEQQKIQIHKLEADKNLLIKELDKVSVVKVIDKLDKDKRSNNLTVLDIDKAISNRLDFNKIEEIVGDSITYNKKTVEILQKEALNSGIEFDKKIHKKELISKLIFHK
ncbi:MAG: hypothetical protein WBG43_07200 [Marinifilaceae bacterium]